jgi:cell wall-associated NlpC family hydrolase
MSFFDFYPFDLEAKPKRKTSASRKKKKSSSKKKASSKRKKKKLDRKKKKAKKKKRKKRRSRRRRRVRNYNPALAKSLSYDLIQKNSPEICALAGFTPTAENVTKPYVSRADTVTVDPEELFASDGEYTEFIELNPGELLDIESFKSLWLRFAEGRSVDDMTEAGIFKQEIMNVIMDWLGTPYLFGGNSSKQIDCSAFTQRIYLNAAGLLLPRTARTQIDVGRPVTRDELEFGDLIFFHTYSYKFPSHVGIYLGDGLFVHASSRYGVVVSELVGEYYRSHFIGGRRLTVHDILRYGNNGDKKNGDSENNQ